MKHTNTPTLRFGEFDGEWSEKSLGSLLSFKNGINATKEQYGRGYKFINVLDIINNDYIMHDDIIGSVDVSKEIFEKNKVEYGNILFQRSSETRIDAGQTNVYLDEKKPSTFGGFIIRGQQKDDSFHPKFMNYMFKTQHARKEITSKSNGSTRYNVGQETLSKVLIYLPKKREEQQKIATFLCVIDSSIKQFSKKEQLLRDYKKGVMQKIFSQEIRFKADDGNEFPNWKEQVLGKFLNHKSVKNKNNKVHLVLSVSNSQGFITQEEQFNGYVVASKDLSNYKIVEKNDFAYNPSRINVGSIAILENFDFGIISPMYIVFSTTELLDNEFLNNMLQTHKFKHLIKIGCSGSVRDSLNFNDMASFKITIPTIEEQTKIANFLSAIDTKIEQTQKQLEATQSFKKSLLQQMFI